MNFAGKWMELETIKQSRYPRPRKTNIILFFYKAPNSKYSDVGSNPRETAVTKKVKVDQC